MRLDFSDRAVLVTGGTRGIGRACALAFARRGARCALTYRWGGDEDEVYRAFAEAGAPRPLLIQANVGDDDDTASCMSVLKDHFPQIDVFISNASSANRITSLQDYSARGLEQGLRHSAFPLIAYTRAISATFGAFPRHVVAMSSTGPDHFTAAYDDVAVTKAALETMARYLSYRLRHEDIRVNVLRSRAVRTQAFEETFGAGLPDFMAPYAAADQYISPEEVADATVALCSGLLDAVKGQVVTVDRGTTFSDSLMRLYMAHEARQEAP